MIWEIEIAKNGEPTLKLNGNYIYSKYEPFKDAEKWTISEISADYNTYCLIGVGLGYHLKALVTHTKFEQIYVYYFDENELNAFKNVQTDDWWKVDRISFVKNIDSINFSSTTHLLIPNAFVNALEETYPLKNLLETIKINIRTYNKLADTLNDNFYKNIKLNDKSISFGNCIGQSKLACLVSAGPTLDETINWLIEYQSYVDIYVVGAALRKVAEAGIKPTAVITSDAKEETLAQFENVNYAGHLYYLSTANHSVVNQHQGKRTILFQNEFPLAEQYAHKNKAPLLDTGGSVATITFSLLEFLGYRKVILFGQDVGFTGQNTHAKGSTSNKSIMKEKRLLKKIKANNGEMIYTTIMLYTFWQWFKEKFKETKCEVYNTALQGAYIPGTKYIDKAKFEMLIKEESNEIG
jgi:hypothetical protein